MMEYMDGGSVKWMAGRTVPARPAFSGRKWKRGENRGISLKYLFTEKEL